MAVQAAIVGDGVGSDVIGFDVGFNVIFGSGHFVPLIAQHEA